MSLPIADLACAHVVHHIFELPPSVSVEVAYLRAISAEPDSAHAMLIYLDDRPAHDRTYLYCDQRMLEGAGISVPQPRAQIDLVLRPAYHNGSRAGGLIQTLAVLTLWFLFAYWVAAGKFPQGTSGSSLIPLMLIAVTIFVGVIVNQNEHLLTKKVFHRVRSRLIGMGSLIFIMAVTAAVGVKGPNERWLLLSLACAATAIWLVSVTSMHWTKYFAARVSIRDLKLQSFEDPMA
jgi:hypothetical protein